MESINSISSPEDLTWGLPPVPPNVSQGDLNATNTSDLPQSTFLQPYQSFHTLSTNAPQPSMTFSNDGRHSPPDIEIVKEADAQPHNPHPAGHHNIPKPISSRSKYGNLDWDSYKEELRSLYLEDNQNLDNTMRIMKERHSFPESKKLYKEKFKVWGWQKNLPGQYAQWMTQKANKRKRDEDKETVFFYGGLQWDKSRAQRSAVRSKKVSLETEVIVVDTPNDIDYKTPRDDVVSPQNALSPGRPGYHNEAGHVVVESEDTVNEAEDAAQDRLFGSKGDSLSGMIAMFRAAQRHASHADSEKAELLFLKALKGYGVLLGPTHEYAIDVAFAVANFYTEKGQFNDADMVVEDLCQHHIKEFGIKHRRTQQVIQQVADLLNGCNRPNDALAFLSRSKELAEADAEAAFRKPYKRSKTGRQGSLSRRHAATPPAEVSDAAQNITAGSHPDQFEDRNQVACTRVAAKDEAVEAFLKAIISNCEHHGEAFVVQNLRARCELLHFYTKLGQNDSHKLIFLDAISTAETIILSEKWESKRFRSFETMEALLALVASVLKAGFDIQAAARFTEIGQKAENDLGWDDERTIWAKIFIGIIYQRYRSWDSAKPWFESARGASFAAWDKEDSVTRSLLAAMETCHFEERQFLGAHYTRFHCVPNDLSPSGFLFEVSDFTSIPKRLNLD